MLTHIKYFKALADETRLRLLHILYHYELNVNEIVTIFSMGQSRISRHLKILALSGLLTSRRDGLWVFYSVPETGPDREFIDAIIPFEATDLRIAADMDMALAMLEERANKTQYFFNSIAEDWDKLTTEVLGSFDLPSAVLERMNVCTTACDLGCGTGNVLEAMLTKATNVIGVDGSARMLELARRRFPTESGRVSLRIGDLSHLPLRDEEADFTCINMVIHHLPSPVEILQEVHRTIRHKGMLLVTDFNHHTDERMRSEYGDRWLGFSSETLELYLKRAGFTAIQQVTLPVERNLSLHLFTAERV